MQVDLFDNNLSDREEEILKNALSWYSDDMAKSHSKAIREEDLEKRAYYQKLWKDADRLRFKLFGTPVGINLSYLND
jgi:hypothetical protein